MIDSVSEQAGATADLKKARRGSAMTEYCGTVTYRDRLPPHDIAAEQGVLSCCMGGAIVMMEGMIDGGKECLKECLDIFGSDAVFYDLRHQEIWNAMVYLNQKDGHFDIITLQAELKARGKLEQTGGIPYLAEVQDKAPSPAFLPDYINLVWERYMARVKLASDGEINARIMESGGELTESGLVVINERHERFVRLTERGAVTPKNLCSPGDFGEEYYKRWFDPKREQYGLRLPFEFPLRWRPSETSLMTGDNGSGKSSMLNLISIVCAKQFEADEKVVIASMEMPPWITLWIMARQLLGIGDMECTPENERRAADALAWLNRRFLIYNFLGITDRHELMNTFQYAAEHRNGKFFIIDNMMKVGIEDDDYAAQGLFIQRVCDFDRKNNVHTIVVVHENKGDGSAKQKVRGSKQLTDAPDNVCGMKRNEEKGQKLKEWMEERRSGELSEEELQKKINSVRKTWDSKFLLSKQRWPGSQQNASRWLYFDPASLQFHEYPDDRPFDFLMD